MTVKHLYAPLLVFATGLLLSTISCQHSPILSDDGPPVDTIPDDPIDTTMNGTPCDPDLVYFDLQVLPILRSNCAKSGCHDAITHEEGVILDSYENVLATTEIKVSDPYDSDILEAIFDDKPEDRMPPPPNTPLSQEYIDLIVDWIVQGAKDLDCDPDSGGCNTDNVTFSQDVFPVMQITCIGCHSGAQPQGNLDLSTYDKIKIVANDGRLLGAIKGESGYVQMPFGGQPLPQCTIDKISAWVADGAPQN
ncbi:MAG: hypothetical protein KDC30_13450 [Saprospiraceae bacterium]|nr:hypothetical protein [Saprospiraceae bacterium]